MSGALQVDLDNPSSVRGQMAEGFKSMIFLCVYCNNPDPVALPVIDFQYDPSGLYVLRLSFVQPVTINLLWNFKILEKLNIINE
jgi:hypothetical protein